MTVALRSVRFLTAGWCGQFARLAGAPSWKWSRFYAVFVYFEHPVHGACLIDTGYSPEFFQATHRFPQRLYRWITPVTLSPHADPAGELKAAGIDHASIQRVFVSHFHADHIGGLNCFPKARLIYRREAYERLRSQPTRAQVRHGFLQELLPDDFEDRGDPLTENQFIAGSGPWQTFRICDYWGDGSLILVDLPGHAEGQFGFVLQGAERSQFYIVDACWHVQVMLEQSRLPWISRNFQHDQVAYFATQEKLRQLTAETGIELLACHCPRTLSHVE